MVKSAKNPGTKIKIILGLLLITSLGIIFGMYSLANASRNLGNAKIRVEESRRDVKLLDKILQDRNLYQEDMTKVKNTLPATYYDVSFFSSELNRLAGENGITLTLSGDQKKKEEKGSFDSVVFTADATGSYTAISNFLSQSTKLPFHTAVENIEFKSDEGKLSTKLRIKIFVEK